LGEARTRSDLRADPLEEPIKSLVFSLAPGVHLHVGVRLASPLSSLVLGAVLSAIVIACGSDPTANKSLPICEEGTEKCPSVPKAGKKAPPSTGGPTGTPQQVPPAEETPPTKEEPKADGGADAEGSKPLGTLCTALQKCCSDLEAAGYSTDACKDVVSTKNENACYAQHKQYKDFGECS
jgi:hypothetical protein